MENNIMETSSTTLHKGLFAELLTAKQVVRDSYPFSFELFPPFFDQFLDCSLVLKLSHAAFLSVHLFDTIILSKLRKHLSRQKPARYREVPYNVIDYKLDLHCCSKKLISRTCARLFI